MKRNTTTANLAIPVSSAETANKRLKQSKIVVTSSKPIDWTRTGKYAPYLKQLKDQGFCVIPDAVDAIATKAMLDGMWEWATLWGIHRADPSSWTVKTAGEWIPGHKHGIIQQHAASHTRPAWQARSEPGVLDVFSKIWDCKVADLETSYDAINFGYAAPRQPKSWYHTDQGSHRSGLWQVQGFVALTQQGPDPKHGALVVRSGSHKQHAAFFEATGESSNKKDWYMHTPEQLTEHFPEAKFPEVQVVAAPGSLVLWDSRTLHYGRQPYLDAAAKALTVSSVVHETKEPVGRVNQDLQEIQEPQEPRDSREPRAVIYVCMKPRTSMTAKSKQKKREWLAKLRTTSHSPDEGKMFQASVRTFSKEQKAEVDARIKAFKAAAALKPNLVFPNSEAIRSYLTSRGAATLLCPK